MMKTVTKIFIDQELKLINYFCKKLIVNWLKISLISWKNRNFIALYLSWLFFYSLRYKNIYPTNTPRVFPVETTRKCTFLRRFNVEYTWCVCRVRNNYFSQTRMGFLYYLHELRSILSCGVLSQSIFCYDNRG